MSARTITVRLTEAQMRALALAVGERSETLSDQADTGWPGAARDAATLERAWSAVREGWHR